MKNEEAIMKLEYPITFFYYKDLREVISFYEEMLGMRLAIDQGFCRIYAINERAGFGIVDELRGSLKASPDKPALLTLVVDDVDAWYVYLQKRSVAGLTPPVLHREIGVYGFFFQDPAGYKIEMQCFLGAGPTLPEAAQSARR
jgi:catechol 2,3-dioxygenase-like lactoylglutathione lyase family enzyme